MKTLYPIGRIAGISVKVHPLTGLLPLGVAAYALWHGFGVNGIIWSLGLVAAMVGCVLLHELGHALAARSVGVPVHDILLLPVGGAARLEGLPGSPGAEALVVFAGPLVNLVLGVACVALLGGTGELAGWDLATWRRGPSTREALATLAVFNLAVFGLNLLPAFPLDGGRLLRALLTNWTTRLRATKIVAALARVVILVAIAFVAARGLYLLVVPLGYLFVVAGREVHLTSVQHFLESQRLGRYALPVRVFDPGISIAEVARQLHLNGQRGAVIADECSPIGFATAEMLAAAPDPTVHVGDLDLLTVACHDSDTALRCLSHQFACHPRSVAIEEIDGRPAGYLDLELLGAAYEAFAKTPHADEVPTRS